MTPDQITVGGKGAQHYRKEPIDSIRPGIIQVLRGMRHMMKRTEVQASPLLRMDSADQETSILEVRERGGKFSSVLAQPMSSNIDPT